MKNVPLVLVLLTLATSALAATPKSYVDPRRAAAIAALLPEKPLGVGRPITDRTAWDMLGKLEGYQKTCRNADRINKEPIPDQSDDLYLIYSRTGSRDEWQKVAFDRRARLGQLVLAEGVRNDGTYLPKIKAYVAALCAEKTWVMPAHDHGLNNFNGKTVEIDLGSSALGWQMATAYWVLGDKLDAGTRTLMLENITRRIIEPFQARYTGRQPPLWWMNGTNNWTAVCLAGTVGAALATVEDRQTRAEFITAAERCGQNYLAGFTPDGYCEEGLGYWNYGFGNYVSLAEMVLQATGGKVDLLAPPAVKAAATFGGRIEIINGISPAIADCHIYPRPDAGLMYYINRRFALGLAGFDTLDTRGTRGLTEEMLYRFPNAASNTPPGSAANYELRTWFNNAGVLICRPAQGSACQLGVAIKGGRNAGSHCHIDTGSFTLVNHDKCIILDAGGERYTARTFSAHRWESKILNSFGHDVPVVAGALEQPGEKARAVVVRTDFTPAADTIVFDITSCYAVPDLQKIERTFVYSRQGAGSLTVTDHATFKTPQTLGTALLTVGKFTPGHAGPLLIEDGKQAVLVAVQATGATKLETQTIKEDGSSNPTRIGINLTEPATDAQITLTITPR